jgi:putative ABC transport system permease protein
MYFGILYMVLMAYIISVFTGHNIDKQSAVIGTLYAMGITKKKLIGSFIIIPALVAFLGGLTGTGLGFLLADAIGEDTVKAYSFPEVKYTYSVGLLLYGLILPVAVTVLVNLFILNKKLSAEPLKLIKKQRAKNKTSKLKLNSFSFDTKFRIRQFIREKKSNISLFAGLFLAIFLMVFGINVYTGVNNYATRLSDDIPFEYMYILKGPAPEIPDEGETAFVKSLDSYCKYAGGDLTVSLQGINKDSRYFSYNLGTGNEVVVSSAAASKFNWKKGDEITLRDTLEEKDYKFKVKSVEEYGYGLYIFMDIDTMCEHFGMPDDYYNIIMSDKELDIDSEYVSSVINSEKIETTGEKYLDSMMGAIVVLLVLSVVIFVVVMFLLIKMMIDKSTFNISLLKVLGYHEKRVRKLYLGSTLYTVIITGLIAVPVCKLVINQLFPYMVYNVAGAFDTGFKIKEYLVIAIIILASYFLSNLILRRYLKKITLAEILKDRE